MNPQLETLTPETGKIYQRTVLNENRLKASVLFLEPGQELESSSALVADEHLLFVIQGRATVQVGEINHVLNQEQALHLARNERVIVSNHGSTVVKVLRVDVKLPLPEPMVVTMPPA